MRTHRCALALAAAALLLCSVATRAQTVPFGKNKIQYRAFDWKVLSGRHVDVYFYPEEERVARLALTDAEEQYTTLERRFHHHPFRRIPLIIYASDQHFEQSNVLGGFIPEGVLGFTEYLKRRVALPFRGDYAQFRHTLRHELVHAFQLSEIEEVEDAHPRDNKPSPQNVLWWTEGLAEYWSSEPSTEDDMFVRDLVLAGNLPTIAEFSEMYGYAAYPLGSALHRWLASRFGEGYIARVYENFWRYDNFDRTLEAVTGEPLEQLSREWKYDLEKRYFPLYADRPPLDVGARRIVWKGGANYQPDLWTPPGDSVPWLLFLSPRNGYTSLYATTLARGERGAHLILEGERSAQFESFHAYESRFQVNRAGVAAIVSRFLDRDALLLWDVRQRRLVGRYQWPDLVGLKSPAWAPDGHRVVFEGLSTSGFSDLYMVDFADGSARRTALTQDDYKDEDPDWSPDGSTIVFSSDRTTAGGSDGSTNLYLYDLASGAIRPLTYGNWQDRSPRWSHDGRRIVFSSDRSGIFDLYAVDTEGSGHRLTTLAGGAFDPQWLPHDRGVVFAGFADGGFAIYASTPGADSTRAPTIALALPASDTLAAAAPLPELGLPHPGWRWSAAAPVGNGQAEPRKYNLWRGFSLDFASGDAAIAPGYGSAQGLQFLASDLLGDHVLFLDITAAQASGFSSLIDNFSGQAIYLNLRHRLNYGVGVYRYSGFFRDVNLDVYRERSVGGLFLASWPFSRYRRIEVQLGLEQGDRSDYTSYYGYIDRLPGDTRNLTRRGFLVNQYVSYVKDNTLWLPTGPIDGSRYNLTAGLVSCFACTTPSPLTGADVTRPAVAENWVLSADWRKYFRLTLRSAYAARAFGYWSDGAIPGRAILGGTWMLRGYPRWSLAGSRVFLLNQEVRFPLLHGIDLLAPWGPVRLPGIQGALFTDLGSSWVERTSPDGAWGNYGLSFRMSLGSPLVLRLDIGHRYSIGAEPPIFWNANDSFRKRFLDFFFGYNY